MRIVTRTVSIRGPVFKNLYSLHIPIYIHTHTYVARYYDLVRRYPAYCQMILY